MASLANSKKGFKKLDNIEMLELREEGNCLEDSGSETELLNFATTSISKKGRRGTYSCGSCYCWCGVLYAGLLTILVLIVGVVSAYALTTVWQLSSTLDDDNSPSQSSMAEQVTALKKDMQANKNEVFLVLDGLSSNIGNVNLSLVSMNATVWKQLNKTARKLRQVEVLLNSVVDGNDPGNSHGNSILDLDTLEKEVASLVRDVSFLNSSMVRMDNVSQQVESFRTILNSLSSRLDELARLNGDAVHNNTYFQDTIQGFADRILQLENRIYIMEKNVSAERLYLHQTSQNLNSNVTSLHSLLGVLNSSLIAEVGELWNNMTVTQQLLHQLQFQLNLLAGSSQSSQTAAPPVPQPSSSVPAEIQPTNITSSFSASSAPSSSSIVGSTEDATNAMKSTIVQESALIQPSLTVLPSVATSRYGEGDVAVSPVTTSAETVAQHGEHSAPASTVTLSTVSFGLDSTKEELGKTNLSDPATESNSMSGVLGGRHGKENEQRMENRPPVTDPLNGKEDQSDMSESTTAKELINDLLHSFEELDNSSDGLLDFEEFSYFSRSKNIFNLIDLNHDQHISRAELETVSRMIERTSLKQQTPPPEDTYKDFDGLIGPSKNTER